MHSSFIFCSYESLHPRLTVSQNVTRLYSRLLIHISFILSCASAHAHKEAPHLAEVAILMFDAYVFLFSISKILFFSFLFFFLKSSFIIIFFFLPFLLPFATVTEYYQPVFLDSICRL